MNELNNEPIILGIKKEIVEEIYWELVQVSNAANSLKKIFEANNIPFSFENIMDAKRGAKEIEKFMYKRLNNDLEAFKTPSIYDSMKKLGEESIWKFLNVVKQVKWVRQAFLEDVNTDLLTMKDGKLILVSNAKEQLNERYTSYLTNSENELYTLHKEATEALNKLIREVASKGKKVVFNNWFHCNPVNGQFIQNTMVNYQHYIE